MNIFKSGTFTWWQVGCLKLAVLSLGVAIGAYWASVFTPYIGILVVLGLVLGIYVAFIWFKK